MFAKVSTDLYTYCSDRIHTTKDRTLHWAPAEGERVAREFFPPPRRRVGFVAALPRGKHLQHLNSRGGEVQRERERVKLLVVLG